MDELTLGLIGAGAVVVGGVVVYNAWQGARVRRRMPRPMPQEAVETAQRDEFPEPSPFIEPAHTPSRREPSLAGGTEGGRIEPGFANAAPLDDANTERFANLVRAMSDKTQFLFISHNKIAMEMAQQLIGVTMQEQGVSRIVAVDMETAAGFAQNTV